MQDIWNNMAQRPDCLLALRPYGAPINLAPTQVTLTPDANLSSNGTFSSTSEQGILLTNLGLTGRTLALTVAFCVKFQSVSTVFLISGSSYADYTGLPLLFSFGYASRYVYLYYMTQNGFMRWYTRLSINQSNKLFDQKKHTVIFTLYGDGTSLKRRLFLDEDEIPSSDFADIAHTSLVFGCNYTEQPLRLFVPNSCHIHKLQIFNTVLNHQERQCLLL